MCRANMLHTYTNLRPLSPHRKRLLPALIILKFHFNSLPLNYYTSCHVFPRQYITSHYISLQQSPFPPLTLAVTLTLTRWTFRTVTVCYNHTNADRRPTTDLIQRCHDKRPCTAYSTLMTSLFNVTTSLIQHITTCLIQRS